MKHSVLLFVFLFSSIVSCKKEEFLEADYLIFGYENHSWGDFCEDYKLTDLAIFEQTSACGDTLEFSSSPMNEASFLAAKKLIQAIPTALWESDQSEFTSKNECYDCGGFFIEFKKGSQTKRFSFTNSTSHDWPKSVITFHDRFTALIQKLPL